MCSQGMPPCAKSDATGMVWKKDNWRSLCDPLGMDLERKGRPLQVFCYRSGNLVCGSLDQISEAVVEVFVCLQPTCCHDRGGTCVASLSWWTWGLRDRTHLLKEVRKRSFVRSIVGEGKRKKAVAGGLVQGYGLGWEVESRETEPCKFCKLCLIAKVTLFSGSIKHAIVWWFCAFFLSLFQHNLWNPCSHRWVWAEW